ncbi:two-component sensor kinase SA14-24 [Geminocystis sp. NIES-3708]|uniref:sensor histidine kinase n=1 Tax=Geminocystis sp. NIES-3708 TaxID=1615909 RepID=UPI0005FCCB74|nr:ATP-binding protein [Geminocystis sp. NIES-3708]BAQ61515.1 two-component sensor kinase SA14-24 [Geminocystis sp. NIES-3708]
MAWATDLIPISKDKFKDLKIKLILYYLSVMIAIFSASGLLIYHIIAHHLYKQFEEHMLRLAENASKILELVKHEHEEYYHEPFSRLTLADLINKSENNNQVTSKNLFAEKNQSIQWFNEKHQLLIQEGNLLNKWNSFVQNKTTHDYDQQKHLFSLILPVYSNNESGELIGYIKVTESTLTLEKNLKLLQWSLTLTGFFILILSTGGAIFLTQESLKPIKASFQELKQFTADASHELRTPLTVISTSTEVILSHPEKIEPSDLTKIQAITTATHQMKILINDLLLLARMDNEKLEKEKNLLNIPIEEMWEDLLDFVQIKAESKKITIESHLVNNILVKGNINHLQQLFSNILNNALQYTPEGGKIIVILEKNYPYAVIKVKDTGIGIKETELKYIFQRFWRGEEGRNHRREGTGLGLAIAEKIVTNYGGKITVDSELGKGSLFCIYLPLS